MINKFDGGKVGIIKIKKYLKKANEKKWGPQQISKYFYKVNEKYVDNIIKEYKYI